MKKNVMVIILITILSKLVGFTREIVLSYFYGASSISDIYLISTTIPIVVFSFIAAGISTAYVPMYNAIRQKKGESQSNHFTSNLIKLLLILCTIIVLLSTLFTEKVVLIFASGFDGETLELAINFTRISILSIYFTGIIIVFNGYLQSNGQFAVPAAIGFPMNIVAIISIILSARINIYFLPIGIIVAALLQLIMLLPFVKKYNLTFRLRFDLKDENIRKMVIIAIPVILGVSVNQINTLVDRTLASQIAIGGISALNYANKLNSFIQGIFVLSVSTVIYPAISKMVAEQKIDLMKNTIVNAIIIVAVLILPATAGMMIFSEEIVVLLFARGSFDQTATILTSSALFYYSIGMIGIAGREVFSRVFFSLQETKIPMKNAAIGMFVNIILNIILSKYLGIAGLALATSIAAIFTASLMYLSLKKIIGDLFDRKIILLLLKLLLSSIVMMVVAKLLFSYLSLLTSLIISLSTAILVGIIVYFLVVYFLSEEVKTIIDSLILKVKKIYYKR